MRPPIWQPKSTFMTSSYTQERKKNETQRKKRIEKEKAESANVLKDSEVASVGGVVSGTVIQRAASGESDARLGGFQRRQ
jgi:hypothetical protein